MVFKINDNQSVNEINHSHIKIEKIGLINIKFYNNFSKSNENIRLYQINTKVIKLK